eukprot:m.179245 g.179245  ORF g.179245 m.179245 type:complete len:517 (-) comp31965_c0_seq1:253-1803(-)
MAELKLGPGSLDVRIQMATKWCNNNDECHGFALDPTNPVTLMYSLPNFTIAAVANIDWTAWWKGPKQPIPPPPPPPPPTPAPPVPPTPDPVWVPCKDDKGCQLNGVCNVTTGRCICDFGWRGENCMLLDLAPPERGQGTCDPSLNGTARGYTTTWGGRPLQDPESGKWHYHVAEMAKHCGMCRWSSVSQVAHYVSDAPSNTYGGGVLGPYSRVDTAVGVFAHNPIVAAVPNSTKGSPTAYIMMHIGNGGVSDVHSPKQTVATCTSGVTPIDNNGLLPTRSEGERVAGMFEKHSSSSSSGRMHVASTLSGPWIAAPTNWTVPTCNNPHPLFLPDGRLMIACHLQTCNLGFYTSLTTDWRYGKWSSVVCTNITSGASYTYNGTTFRPANEDPDLYIDKRGHLHVLTHNQSPCYSGTAAPFFGADVRGCGAHFFSDDLGNTWSFAWHAVYNGTVVYTDGTHMRYKRERPKLIQHPVTKELVALANGIGVEILDAFEAGNDSACSLVVGFNQQEQLAKVI